MKKLSSMMALGFLCLMAIAKPTFNADQFKSYTSQMQTLSQKYLDANEAENAGKVVDKWVKDYYLLSAGQQTLMKSELATILFTKSKVYAVQNERGKALKAMREAISNGFKDYQSASTAPELASVRNDQEFVKLLDSIKG
jgi:hypothetical protein